MEVQLTKKNTTRHDGVIAIQVKHSETGESFMIHEQGGNLAIQKTSGRLSDSLVVIPRSSNRIEIQ